MKKKNQVLIDFFCPTYEAIERFRIYLSKKAGHRLKDIDIAIFLKLPVQTVGNFKARQSPILLLHIIKWCVDNHLDPTPFIKKSDD